MNCTICFTNAVVTVFTIAIHVWSAVFFCLCVFFMCVISKNGHKMREKMLKISLLHCTLASGHTKICLIPWVVHFLLI